MAPQDSPSCQEQPLGRTKPLHSFHGIGGARGRKATRGKGQRGEKISIKSNETQNDLGQHPCVRGLTPSKQSFQFFRYLPKIQTGRPFPGRDHQVRRSRQRIFVQAKKLPDPALDAVPLDRRTDFSPHRDPQPGMGQTVGADGNSENGESGYLAPSLEIRWKSARLRILSSFRKVSWAIFQGSDF